MFLEPCQWVCEGLIKTSRLGTLSSHKFSTLGPVISLSINCCHCRGKLWPRLRRTLIHLPPSTPPSPHMVSLCSSDWPGTCYIDQADLKVADLLAVASQRLKVFVTMPSLAVVSLGTLAFIKTHNVDRLIADCLCLTWVGSREWRFNSGFSHDMLFYSRAAGCYAGFVLASVTLMTATVFSESPIVSG